MNQSIDIKVTNTPENCPNCAKKIKNNDEVKKNDRERKKIIQEGI
ncbi:hypothetical protein A3Q56_08260 [Intoshia linei]|uniref:Uncharacterized protein n=1 Tax=Intoshia linei TaxID=1819745 RepID=A0A177APX6_9BILA|nr:hypothetical protein A3Q56_08260 [Intoshia linei]